VLETNNETDIPYQIESVSGRIRWSKDGRSILVYGGDSTRAAGLFKIDVQTGQSTILLPDQGNVGSTNYDWSFDGTGLFYLLNGGHEILRRDLSSRTDTLIYSGMSSFVLSEDGLWLATISVDIKTGLTGVAIVPARGGNARKILTLRMPEFISEMTWTPDGREIVFAKGRRDLIDQPHELWSVPASGGTPRPLGIQTEYVQSLSFHPDGRQMAISTYTDTSEVWVVENFLQQGISKN